MSRARTLNSLHFTLLDRRVEGDYEYQSYRTVNSASTMILFSETQPSSPIAAVSFLPRSTGGNAKTVLTRRTKSADTADGDEHYASFQGLANVDNDEFAFALHNLTDFVSHPSVRTHSRASKGDIGYLKIDILGEKHRVCEVDLPDIAVNQVNELRPSESVLVQCDQRNRNRTMVLRGVVDEQSGRSVAVADDDAVKNPKEKKGTYFYINVLASSFFPEMVSLFEKTTWRAADVFVRRVPKYNGMAQHEIDSLSRRVLRGERSREGMGNRPFGSRGVGIFGARGNVVGSFWPDRASRSRVATFGSASTVRSNVKSTTPSFGRAALSNCAEQSNVESATPTFGEVSKSQVGKVVSGSRSINVVTSQTGHEYAYDRPGEKVCLGLSVWRDMRLLEPLTEHEARQEAAMQLEDAAANQSRELLKTLAKIYKEENCAICCASEPSIVFLQCGHECICEECLRGTAAQETEDIIKKCPLCRAHIVAKVSTKTICH